MILSICDNSTVQEILSIISIAVKIICIVVPIILIVSLMINITKKLSDGKGDILNDMGSTIIPKVIAAILVFFIPTFVDIIGKITLSDVDYRECIKFETLKEIHLIEDSMFTELTGLKTNFLLRLFKYYISYYQIFTYILYSLFHVMS